VGMTPLEEQFSALKAEYPAAVMQTSPAGGAVITLPEFPLPPGWSQPRTTVTFVAPVGYPLARPDCFWASPDLRLQNGSMPQNTNHQPVPGTNNAPQLWFSWHVGQWNPNRDSLLTYLRVMERRLQEVR
jgi:hypothetical protein